jgi:WD40 repeat protein/transcriptional regulator with XRE-family HTH domain
MPMRTHSYGERDYNFGQAIATLRTAMNLTQVALAQFLGVSRGAVLGWEAGSSYPKPAGLKRFIALGVKHQAFAAGREEEEIRALWQAAHQKVLLDEPWLSSLLGKRPPPLPHVVPGPIEGNRPRDLPVAGPAPGRRVDWDDALAVPSFYGRKQELATLEQWIVQERCRVVSVLGMGGIGKSALSVTLMHQVAERFEVVLFRSLRDAPSCEAWLADCLQVLSPQPLAEMPASLQGRLSLLLERLRERRALLVLDNLEALLQEGNMGGHYRPGYEEYGYVLRRVGETAHQSCLLVTSREKPADLVLLEGTRSPVRVLRLGGLDAGAGAQLLAEKGVAGTPEERARLVEAYAGNPLALKVVAETIADLFVGEIGPFLKQSVVIFGSIQDLLAGQIARLSAVEQIVLHWLAIVREPLSLEDLLVLLVAPGPAGQMLSAVDNLRRRSLIERGKLPGSFTLQSVVLEYVTRLLIEEAAREITQGQLSRLIEHGLSHAGAREDVRQTQERLIVAPILAHLRSAYPGRAEVEERLLSLLAQLRERASYAQGYGPANLVALLRELSGNLRGLDLSQLAIRGAYLQGVEMQDATLSGTTFRDTVFTEALDATWAVAISSTGQYWAAGSRRGEVRVWREGGRTLHLAWQAHTDTVMALAFSPDERQLASGSWDGTITLWDLERSTPLWSVWQPTSVLGVAFTPDGRTLASNGNDAIVRFWDPHSGTPLETLPHPAPVFAVAWSPDGRLLASGDLEGCIRVWEMHAAQPATCVTHLTGHTSWVRGLAFAPDGTHLASASWDRTVRLWDVASGRCLHTLEGHTERVQTVAWSPDGRTVASAGVDATIWLWDAKAGSSRAVLQGHSAPVHSLAFTPDSHRLLSGGEEGILRVWDVARGQCVRLVQGHAVGLYDVDWSPDGTHLASIGSDTLVTVWDLTHGTPPRLLQGHRWSVEAVGWSPDGKTLASCGWDNAIRLWNPATGTCVQILRDADHPDTLFRSVAWSPDGRLLAGGRTLYGLQVWDVTARTPRWVSRAHPTMIRRVAWSPDGTRLASGGDEGSLYVWDASDGTLLARLQGHHGMVASVVWSPDGPSSSPYLPVPQAGPPVPRQGGGSRLASGGGSQGQGGSGEIFLWDAHSGERLHTFVDVPGTVLALDWSPRDPLLVSGGSDGMLCWWDVQSGEYMRVCQGHQGAIRSLRISPDGRRLASCGEDGTIKVWDMDSGELLRTLRRDRPYERLNITGVQGLTEAQKATLRALGAIEEVTPPL